MKSMKWLEEKGGNPGILVARGGIEPPTHGFSVHHFVISPINLAGCRTDLKVIFNCKQTETNLIEVYLKFQVSTND